MGIKKSVMLSDSTVDYLRSHTRDENQIAWSQLVNGAVAELTAVYRDLLPELDTDQWQIILNTYSGCMLEPLLLPPRIASDIMDDLGAIDVNALDDVTKSTVLAVHALSQAEQLAVLDLVNRFWAKNWNDAGSLADVIAQLSSK